jgi:DNA-binding winged helix-turn-helix (wHTH) protein
VWRSTPEAGTNVVDVYITYLRKKLGAAHPEDHVWTSVIETVRGFGYRMCDRRRIPRIEPVIPQGLPQPEFEVACRA